MERNNLAMTWSKLETYSTSIGSMPYKGFRIDVYKLKSHVPSSEDPPRYVYMPALLLDHCSPESRWNQVSGRAELLFTVRMWDEELEALVFEYVKGKDAAVQPHQIQVIPFESVIVTSMAPSMQSSDWMSYQDKSEDLRVVMICSSVEEANRLSKEMKTHPSQFLPILKVKFSLETKTVRTKETCINIEHIRDGKLFADLLHRYPEAETALLTADGVQQLISESLTKVVANSFDDNEVVTKDSVLYSKLKDLIVDSQVTINEQSKGMWDSVFWDNDNYRPDRTAKIITDAYNHSDDQSRSKLRDIFSGSSSNSVDVDQMLKDVVVCRRSDSESSKDRQASDHYKSEDSADERAKFSADKNKSERKKDQEQNSNKTNSLGGSLKVGYAMFSGKGSIQSTNDESSASKTSSTDMVDRNSTNAQASKTKNSNTSAGSNSSHKDLAKSSSSQDDLMTERKGATSAANQESFYEDQQKEELAKVLKNSKSYVEWTGEKFQPKPMKLTKVHLAKFMGKQTFQDTRVTVSYSSATLMTGLHLYPKGSCCSEQTKQLDTVKLTLLQQIDNIKNNFEKEVEKKDRLLSTIQKQNDDFKVKLAKQTEMVDSLQSTIQKQSDETLDKFAKQKGEKDRLESTLQKQMDEMKDKFAKEMEQKDRSLDTIQKQNDEFKVELAAQNEQIKGLERERNSLAKLLASVSQRTTDGFLWRIDNVKARMAKAEILESDEFYTWKYGYKLKAKVYFNSCGVGEGTYLSVLFKVMPGEYDGLLEWPFPHSVTFTLYDQAIYPNKASNVTMNQSVIPLEDRLPTSKSYLGFSKFISHEMLKARHFFKDDVMFLRITCGP